MIESLAYLHYYPLSPPSFDNMLFLFFYSTTYVISRALSWFHVVPQRKLIEVLFLGPCMGSNEKEVIFCNGDPQLHRFGAKLWRRMYVYRQESLTVLDRKFLQIKFILGFYLGRVKEILDNENAIVRFRYSVAHKTVPKKFCIPLVGASFNFPLEVMAFDTHAFNS